MKPTVLCYNLSGTKKGRQIAMIFGFLGYKVRHVEKKEYLQPVGVLAGALSGNEDFCHPTEDEACENTAEKPGADADGDFRVHDEKDFQEEMLVMNPPSEEMLNKALSLMKKEKVQVALKAVITEHNLYWSGLELYKEIKREHEYMNGREKKEKGN